MSTETNPAAAQGQLRDRPVPRLVQQIFRKRVTGRLVVTDDASDSTVVYLREGHPVHIESPNEIDRLDHILTVSGAVLPAVIAQANEEVSRTGRRLGDVLVVRGHITREGLADVLKTQMRRKLTRLFFARQGNYEVFIEAHLYGSGDEFEAMRVDPRGILYAGIRTAYDDDRLRKELAPLSGYSFRLISVPPQFLKAMGFADNDPTLTALRERALTLDDLPRKGGKPADARAIVLALLYADLLETTAVAGRQAVPAAVADARSNLSVPVVAAMEKRTTWTSLPAVTDVIVPPGGRRVAAPTPAHGVPARTPAVGVPVSEPSGLRVTLSRLAGQLDRASHFELLGVSESATSDEVNAAYMRAVRQFHPDRLAAASLRDLAPQAEKVVARLGEAAAVLRDPKQRAAYVAARSGAPEPPAAMAVLEAENRFSKGEVFLKKGDYGQAVESFTEALKLNPVEPQYKAYLAWARFDDPRARKEVVVRDTLAVLEETVRERPKFARGFYWAGQVHKFLNDPDRAEKSFRDAMAADREFLEAERELRLLEMRRVKAAQVRSASPAGPASAAKPGLFGKLFKRED